MLVYKVTTDEYSQRNVVLKVPLLFLNATFGVHMCFLALLSCTLSIIC